MKIDESQLKHLDFIQQIINRLANNGFIIKGWVITVSLAGFGLYFSYRNKLMIILVIFGTFIFWFLDAYYLKQERLFRLLYEDIAKNKKNQMGLSMVTKKYEKKVGDLSRVAISYPTSLFYITIILLSLIFWWYI